jgi:hypothetical protein
MQGILMQNTSACIYFQIAFHLLFCFILFFLKGFFVHPNVTGVRFVLLPPFSFDNSVSP